MRGVTNRVLAGIVLLGNMLGVANAGVYQLSNLNELFGFEGSFGGSVDPEGNVSGFDSYLDESGQSLTRIIYQVPGTQTARFIEPADLGVDFFRDQRAGGQVGAFAFEGRTPQAGDSEAFTYSETAGVTEIGAFAEFGSQVSAMNQAGQVAGYSYLSDDSDSRAFLYTPGEPLLDLGTLGGNFSRGLGINELGHVVGTSRVAFDIDQGAPAAPFVWTPEGGMQLITDTPGFATSGRALDINESGWVVGELRGDIFIRTSEGTFIEGVGEFMFPDENFSRTIGGAAEKILEADFAAFGTSTVQNGANTFFQEPWRWDPVGGTEFFDEFEIVGFGEDEWDFGGFLDANEAGQILAGAFHVPSNRSFTVLLTPVPEPSAALLLALALGAAGILRRGKK